MKRSDLNSEFRAFARELSPTPSERELVSVVYASVCSVLSSDNCIQIGSFPRFTAITPVHDLDVIFCLGPWDSSGRDPDEVMHRVVGLLETNFKNPTDYRVVFSMQSHSVTAKFLDAAADEVFAVDIVPAYSKGKNEYGDMMYMVPQVDGKRRGLRKYEWEPMDNRNWISSDPRGYIRLATEVGENSDFRKTVKLVKYWKGTIRDIDADVKLKSFHLEQIVLRQFQQNPGQDVFGALFDFFLNLPNTVLKSNQIMDRAQPGKFIDDYIADMSGAQLALVTELCDCVLIKLEEARNEIDVQKALTACKPDRDEDDAFLFEEGIPMLCNPELKSVEIECEMTRLGNRATRRRCKKEGIPLNYELRFINKNSELVGEYWWKVKNSRELPMEKRRGELTLGHTKCDPEHTEYIGRHYVECYRVVNGECIDFDKFDVNILGDGDLSS